MNQVVLALGFGLVAASIIAIGAVGFTVQYAISHIVNLTYGPIMSAGAYLAYVAIQPLGNIWLAMVVGSIGAAGLSVLLYRGVYAPFLRRGANVFVLIMVSLGLNIVVLNGIQAIAGPDSFGYNLSREQSVRLVGMVFTPRELVIIAIAVVVMFSFHGLLRLTRLGKAMRAIADDPDLARTSGVAVSRITLIAWGLSGAMCGLAGVALAVDTVAFDSSIGTSALLVVVAAAVVGGIGSPYGAMLGALVIGIVTELAAIVAPNMKDVAAFGVLVLIVLARSVTRQSTPSFEPEGAGI